MREADNIRAVEALGVDWMGFIFWPESKRFCNRKPDYLPTRCKRVGVFVNADVADVVRYAVEYGLNIVQLHGDENRQYIMQMRQALAAAGVKCAVIKALAIKSAADIAQCENYVGFVGVQTCALPICSTHRRTDVVAAASRSTGRCWPTIIAS